ncbi:MAG: hypothetical protein KGI27_02905 [Thaumarchaeota archaeon]|nr:hypothetical protein [Nitrososphaerota archaeon]
MNFGKIFDRKKSDGPGKNMEEIYKIKEEIDREDKIFEKELPVKYALLQEFDVNELKKMCSELLGRDPPADEYDDNKTGGRKSLPKYKEDYVHFITDELDLSEIRKYALKNKIISEEFFKKSNQS